MKLVNTFEDKKDQSPMILWLILNNPIGWSTIPKHLLVQDSNKLVVDPFYKKFEVLSYVFPLNRLILTLDNLSRQQVCDLYIRLVQPDNVTCTSLNDSNADKRESFFSEVSYKKLKVTDNYLVSQIDRNFVFKFEGEYSKN